MISVFVCVFEVFRWVYSVFCEGLCDYIMVLSIGSLVVVSVGVCVFFMVGVCFLCFFVNCFEVVCVDGRSGILVV